MSIRLPEVFAESDGDSRLMGSPRRRKPATRDSTPAPEAALDRLCFPEVSARAVGRVTSPTRFIDPLSAKARGTLELDADGSRPEVQLMLIKATQRGTGTAPDECRESTRGTLLPGTPPLDEVD